ncbi:hypothetical protein KIW84_074631 [Lathyrus oleraceus]|uniref:Pre-rRNA-processing protein Ipi1 N-terminal domain-containing protein n=1 Tax=Pisum sativum TaxID=3888 RepID=A0A9D5A0T1_PEA|nr:hypothetical protein KIW84_074631 [Pisum sativum]
MMAYIFNAMTHLADDIRFMAFDFLDLTLEYYPPSFSSYTEKIFQNYEDILRKNQYHLQDKEKLKDTFAGLVRCLSLLPWNKEETDLQNKDDIGQRVNQDVKIADVPDVVNTSQSTPEHLLEALVSSEHEIEMKKEDEEELQLPNELLTVRDDNRRLMQDIDYGGLCGSRCGVHSRPNLCNRSCGTCCVRCKCVPPGTSGNRELCGACYTEMTNHNLQQSSSADNIKHNKFCYNNLPNAIPGVPIVAKKINSLQFKSTEVVKPA